MEDNSAQSDTVSSKKADANKPTNPQLPTEVAGFEKEKVEQPFSLTLNGWWGALRGAEIKDKNQKIKARPWFAWGIGTLLVIQNIGVWFIVVWALNSQQLDNLEIIFSALIGGTLTQSYFLLRLITEKVFRDIDYHNADEQKKDKSH